MDLTQGTLQEKVNRSKKMMLWFAMLSMTMTFAGLISAIVVSQSRRDWEGSFVVPPSLIWSTIVIVISSVTIHLALQQTRKNKGQQGVMLLLATLVLGVLFVVFQIKGFSYLNETVGVHFTGPTSDVASSFLFILVTLHMAHLASGIIVLLVLIYNHFKQRYKPGQMLGLELGVTFWHFLDVIWVLLFLFLYFVGK